MPQKQGNTSDFFFPGLTDILEEVLATWKQQETADNFQGAAECPFYFFFAWKTDMKSLYLKSTCMA